MEYEAYWLDQSKDFTAQLTTCLHTNREYLYVLNLGLRVTFFDSNSQLAAMTAQWLKVAYNNIAYPPCLVVLIITSAEEVCVPIALSGPIYIFCSSHDPLEG